MRKSRSIGFAFVVSLAVVACGIDDPDQSSARQPLLGLPLPLPPLPLDLLSLAPPALPTIPTGPQHIPPDAPTTSGTTQVPFTGARIDAKLLVISADGKEADLTWIRQVADYTGVPYTLYIASATPGGFVPSMLSDGNAHAYYQGIVLTTGSLGYFNGSSFVSGFSPVEWQTLWDYQGRYKIRTLVGFVFPTADYGYGPPTGVDTTTAPIAATLPPAGAQIFRDVETANPLTISKAWTYLAAPVGTDTTVLMNDAQGHALALLRNYPDGRKVMSMTFDGNFFLVHSLALSYGAIRWVTGGLFVGERHAYVTPQIDDIFLDNDIYSATPKTYRITGTDWTALTTWQTQKHADPRTAQLLLHMAFNGQGTTGIYFPDTLTPAARLTQGQFPWINHTYTHENLDNASYAVAFNEIRRNQQTAVTMGFSHFDPATLVTPDISGLSSPEAMGAAYDAGIRYVVTDTSRAGMDNPTPQAGILNWVEPGILMIPRRPVNLFYNVSNPSEWTTEYNAIYHSFWGRDLTYTEILDTVSDVLVQYMLRGENDPWMFHQANLCAYDGIHSLLGDLLDRTIAKYRRVLVLPVKSPTMTELGHLVQSRMTYNDAGVAASFVPGSQLTLSSVNDTVVPVTGLCSPSGEVYNGECISYVPVTGGQSTSFTLQ